MKRCLIVVLLVALISTPLFAGEKEKLIAESEQIIKEMEAKRIRLIEIQGVLRYLAEKEKEEVKDEGGQKKE